MSEEPAQPVNTTGHKGHESLHEELLYLILFAIIGSQIALLKWKSVHYSSYQISTLVGLTIMPIVYSVMFSWWTFLFFQLLYNAANGYVLHLAGRPPGRHTAKRLYTWFFVIYKTTYYAASGSWVLLLAAQLLHIPSPRLLLYANVALLISLYVAVLNRDFAEFCTSRLARRLGYGGQLPERAPAHACLCWEGVQGDGLPSDTPRTLPCGHTFHEWCLRGWLIIGKQDMCPHCMEKVNIKELFANPWDKPSLFWLNLMDAMRYFVVWNPILLLLLHYVVNWLDKEPS